MVGAVVGWGTPCAMGVLLALPVSVMADASTDTPNVPSSETTEAGRARFSPIPIVSYAPETNLVLGGLMVTTLRLRRSLRENRSLRPASIQASASYSFARQGVVDIIPSVYFDDETWRVSGKLGWRRFPQKFWGVGANDLDEAERYTEDRWIFRLRTTRRIVASLRGGLGVRLRHRRFHDLEENGVIQTGQVEGADGGREVGLSAQLVWDDRDNNFSTQRGGRHAIEIAAFSEALGSEYTYQRLNIDLRQFVDVGWGVFGVQLFADRVWGDAPFRSLPVMGGEDRMRGIFRGRYVDRALLMGQMEYRMPIYWRFGAAVFFGLGAIGRDFGSLELADLYIAGGGGLRFAVDELDHINLRFDVARASDGSWNLYFTLGEAF